MPTLTMRRICCFNLLRLYVPLPRPFPAVRGRSTVRVGASRNPAAKARANPRSPRTVAREMEENAMARAQYRRFQERRDLAAPLLFTFPLFPPAFGLRYFGFPFYPWGLGGLFRLLRGGVHDRRERRVRVRTNDPPAVVLQSLPARTF